MESALVCAVDCSVILVNVYTINTRCWLLKGALEEHRTPKGANGKRILHPKALTNFRSAHFVI